MVYYMAVAFGGALGALSRHWLMSSMRVEQGSFPWGTFTVNVLGSLLIGILFIALADRAAPEWRGLLIVGFLGAFTTFSTYSLEALLLIEQGRLVLALAYILGSVVLCVTAAGVGMAAARLVL